MTPARSRLLVGVSLAAGVVAVGLGLLGAVEVSFLPTIGLGAFMGVLTLGLAVVLPHEEPRPIARPARARRQSEQSGDRGAATPTGHDSTR